MARLSSGRVRKRAEARERFGCPYCKRALVARRTSPDTVVVPRHHTFFCLPGGAETWCCIRGSQSALKREE